MLALNGRMSDVYISKVSALQTSFVLFIKWSPGIAHHNNMCVAFAALITCYVPHILLRRCGLFIALCQQTIDALTPFPVESTDSSVLTVRKCTLRCKVCRPAILPSIKFQFATDLYLYVMTKTRDCVVSHSVLLRQPVVRVPVNQTGGRTSVNATNERNGKRLGWPCWRWE